MSGDDHWPSKLTEFQQDNENLYRNDPNQTATRARGEIPLVPRHDGGYPQRCDRAIMSGV